MTELIISSYREQFYIQYTRFTLLYQGYRYIEDCYIGVLSHTFYCNFYLDIEFSSLYREYRYIEAHYIRVTSTVYGFVDFSGEKNEII